MYADGDFHRGFYRGFCGGGEAWRIGTESRNDLVSIMSALLVSIVSLF